VRKETIGPHMASKPYYATKDYVYCDLCRRVERIPKMGENKHWRGLWPLSLEEIAINGVDWYEYYDTELRQEILDKLDKGKMLVAQNNEKI
jgi:hypothetical protein